MNGDHDSPHTIGQPATIPTGPDTSRYNTNPPRTRRSRYLRQHPTTIAENGMKITGDYELPSYLQLLYSQDDKYTHLGIGRHTLCNDAEYDHVSTGTDEHETATTQPLCGGCRYIVEDSRRYDSLRDGIIRARRHGATCISIEQLMDLMAGDTSFRHTPYEWNYLPH